MGKVGGATCLRGPKKKTRRHTRPQELRQGSSQAPPTQNCGSTNPLAHSIAWPVAFCPRNSLPRSHSPNEARILNCLLPSSRRSASTGRQHPPLLREGLRVPASALKPSVNARTPDYSKNSRKVVDLVTQIKNEEHQIAQGGGAKAIESQHKKGRLTARDRIAKLIDPSSHFFELSAYAAWEMYEEWGGAPAAGTVTGLARVCGRMFMVIANDATVKAGAFFPM